MHTSKELRVMQLICPALQVEIDSSSQEEHPEENGDERTNLSSVLQAEHHNAATELLTAEQTADNKKKARCWTDSLHSYQCKNAGANKGGICNL